MSEKIFLSNAGHISTRIATTAKVHFGEGPKITFIELSTVGEVPGIDQETFEGFAEQAKKGSPVSQALAAVEMRLVARFAQKEVL